MCGTVCIGCGVLCLGCNGTSMFCVWHTFMSYVEECLCKLMFNWSTLRPTWHKLCNVFIVSLWLFWCGMYVLCLCNGFFGVSYVAYVWWTIFICGMLYMLYARVTYYYIAYLVYLYSGVFVRYCCIVRWRCSIVVFTLKWGCVESRDGAWQGNLIRHTCFIRYAVW